MTRLVVAAFSICMLSAWAQVPGAKPFPPPKPFCADCGTVRAVDIISRYDRRPGRGMIIGVVLGAKTASAATAPSTFFHVTIDMDDGKTRQINVPDLDGLTMGSKVRVINGDIQKLG